jgi:hypothetical protein
VLRDALVANFREQMKLRHRVMEIDNHILGLTMEFERQNIIVTEWEMEKAKSAHFSFSFFVSFSFSFSFSGPRVTGCT